MLRRIFGALMACALALIAFPALAGGALYPYYSATGCELVDGQGRVVTGAGYESINEVVSSTGERRFIAYTAGADGYSTALLGDDGQPLTDIAYDYIYQTGDSLITRAGDMSGVIGWDGAEILPARYTMIVPTDKGTYLTSTDDVYDSIADEIYLTYADGHCEYLNLTASYLSGFYEGLAFAQARNGLYGYLDASGQWAIPPIYDYAQDFRDGKAVVTTGGCQGLIDSSGGTILPAKYSTIVSSGYQGSSALIITITDATATLYDKRTLLPVGVVSDVVYAYMPGFDLAVLNCSDHTSVYDARGKELLSISDNQYIEVLDGDRAIVGDYSGNVVTAQVVDMSGRVLVDGINDAIALWDGEETYGICASRARMRTDAYGNDVIVPGSSRWGVYDLDGAEVLPMEYDSITAVCRGIFSVKQGEWYGLIDSDGSWILKESEYDLLQD